MRRATSRDTARWSQGLRPARPRSIRAPHRTRRLVDVRTADANGESLASDVIAGIDWILAHRAQYDIRVVNLSMVGDTADELPVDPLDKAVERLWFSGIVVVAAAGNNGAGTGEVDMSAAPGNDPFVITVGAIDQAQTSATRSTTSSPPWSAYGHTMDGFAKPEISAPGRYLVDAGAADVHDRRRAARPRRRSRLHVDVRHVVRGAGRVRRGRADAGPAPELDARPGQGRADADCARRYAGAAAGRPRNGQSGYAVLAGSTVTSTGPTIVSGDLGLSPGTSVTGFPPGLMNGGVQNVANAAAVQAKAGSRHRVQRRCGAGACDSRGRERPRWADA